MNKIIILENGLTIILNQNKNKYRATAKLYIKAGGLNTEFVVDNKKNNLPYGTAHFLEHYLMEHSIYGNIFEIFSNEYISSNGETSYWNTKYYMSSVHDFEENFVKLLNVVNNPKFSQKNINLVKKPIIQEIKKSKDQPRKKFTNKTLKSIFKYKIHNKLLGSIDSVNNMNIDMLKSFHKIFYHPSNQIITITGNFSDNILDIIRKEYNKFKIEKTNIKRVTIEEPKNVVSKYQELLDSTINDDLLEINYKICIEDFKSIDKNKIDYYFSYLFYSNFDENSELFHKMFNEKLTIYSIETYLSPNIINDFMIVTLRVYTKDFKKVINLLQNQIKNPIINNKEFLRWKNKKIIDIINLSENKEWVSSNLVNNILLYELYEYDDIEFIKNLNIDECKYLLGKIDYSNYTITINNTNLKNSKRKI